MPENVKVRTSISLPARITTAANAYRTAHPTENLDDFSALVAEALTEYLERHHPGLLAAATAALRAYPGNFQQAEEKILSVAEDAAPIDPPAAQHLAGAATDSLKRTLRPKATRAPRK